MFSRHRLSGLLGKLTGMLSALLPGVRELRTPFITGVLWAACTWLLLGSQITESAYTKDFIDKYQLSALPTPIWIGVGSVCAYLVGSLLVIRTSPFTLVQHRIRRWLEPVVGRLSLDRKPARRRYRWIWQLWQLWQRFQHRWPISWLKSWAEEHSHDEAVDHWLRSQFRDHLEVGRVPVMRGVNRGCTGPPGFEAFYSIDSVRATLDLEREEGYDPFDSFIFYFIRDIKDEQPAIEARIQMRFPEVYAEIDRLKVEGELRLSIFWPMTVLILLLAFMWSPDVLPLLLVPPLLLAQGFSRLRDAADKTWSVFTTGDVTSPLLDTMAAATERSLRDFTMRDLS